MQQIIGHSKATAFLKHCLDSGRISHAYLFVGPEHVGKMTMAVALAQALNCEGEPAPCGQCRPCQRIASANHSDVQIISRLADGESGLKRDIGIGQIRDLQQSAALQPYEGRHRVFIIEDAGHLNEESSNCLLKTLEEPPPNVTIVLLTEDEAELLPTIVSRCHRVNLRPVPATQIEQALVEQCQASAASARALSRLCRGRVGWAMSACHDEGMLQKRLGRLRELVDLANASRADQFAYAAKLATLFARSRDSVEEVLRLWLEWWRDLLLVKTGCAYLITNVDSEDTLRQQSERYDLRETRDFIEAILTALSHLAQNANPRLALEVLMLSIPGARPVVSAAGRVG